MLRGSMIGERGARAALLGVAALFAAGCVHRFTTFEAKEVPPAAGRVLTPVKAHMRDGSVAVFASGAWIDSTSVRGSGMRAPLRAAPFRVESVPLDSVVGVETFSTGTNTSKSVLASVGASAVVGVGTLALAKALFGSCPTFYADSAGAPVLQAEGFSYAIAPIFEHRDTDRLRVTPSPDGLVRLEVRNEALETHYLNHLELLEVEHERDEAALTDERNAPVLVRGLQPVTAARDASGRDVSRTLALEDGDVYVTPATLIASRSASSLEDHVEFTVSAPGRDSAVVVLRLRNSLLNTVLLYQEMLAGSGARALDWMGQDLARISTALALGEWYVSQMGLRVQVVEGDEIRPVARISDAGPIAFHDVAVVVPVARDGRARVRLSFVADNWRIDRVAYAGDFRRTTARAIPLADVRATSGAAEVAALRSLSVPDEDYLVTTPGQAFSIEFDAGVRTRARTFFLASQGYYVEWMRPDWLRRPATTEAFAPSNARLYSALTRWGATRESFEREFYASKIPTR